MSELGPRVLQSLCAHHKHQIDVVINFEVDVITEGGGGQFLMLSDAWNRISRINGSTSRCQDCDMTFCKLLLNCIWVVCVIDIRHDIRISHDCTSVITCDAVLFTFHFGLCFVCRGNANFEQTLGPPALDRMSRMKKDK